MICSDSGAACPPDVSGCAGECVAPLSYNTGGLSDDDPSGCLVGLGVEALISRAGND